MSKMKISRGERVFGYFNIVFMLFMVVITFYPILYVVFAAVSKPSLYMAHSGALLHSLGFSLSSFQAVFKNPNVLSGYKNTFIIVTSGIALNMLLTIMGAYFLSRKGVMLRTPITLLIIFTMYFSGGLIPEYLNIQGFGMINKISALLIPTAINTYNLIIMRTAFAGVPDSLEESAKLDGAGHVRILSQIMVPLVTPTIAVLVLYYGVSHWNSWFPAMIYMRDKSKYPLQLILREVIVQNDTASMTSGAGYDDAEMLSETIKYATIIVSTVPVLLLYPFLQRFFVKGVMVGAVKG